MKKVSVIVPVYNVEKYLRRCLDSLVHQSLEDIEVIVVNDASPDESWRIMKEYEHCYPEKIKCIILKENLRQGGARNRGMEYASGEYVTFVDSDDWMDITALEKMYLSALKTESDVVFCNYQVVTEDMTKKRNKALIFKPITGELTIEKKKVLLFSDSCPWGKIIRRSIITEHNIDYPEHVLYEDAPTTPFYLLYAKKIEKVDESLYFYFERENSVTHAMNQEHHFDFSKMALVMLKRFEERGFMEQYREEILMRFTKEYYLHPLMCCIQSFTVPPIQYFNDLKRGIKKYYPDYLDNRYLNQIYEPLSVWMASSNDENPEKMIELYKTKKINYISLYEGFYRKQKDKIDLLKKYLCENNICCAVWGAGDMGRGFLEVFDDMCEVVKCVFDSNRKVHGTFLDTGHVVKDFEECEKEITLILIINRNYYLDIRETIHKKSATIKLMNVDDYLKNNIELSEWIE